MRQECVKKTDTPSDKGQRFDLNRKSGADSGVRYLPLCGYAESLLQPDFHGQWQMIGEVGPRFVTENSGGMAVGIAQIDTVQGQ